MSIQASRAFVPIPIKIPILILENIPEQIITLQNKFYLLPDLLVWIFFVIWRFHIIFDANRSFTFTTTEMHEKAIPEMKNRKLKQLWHFQEIFGQFRSH